VPREQLLVETFVTLADTLVDDYDVIDFLQVLAEGCVDLLDVSAAGIMLADPAGSLRHAACSSEQMRLVELFELQVEQGPCFDAFRDQTSVVSSSLEETEQRWPKFAPSAAEHGFVFVSAVPMRLRARAVGALNMFSTTQHGLSADDMRVAQGMADVASIGILQQRAIRDANELAGHLEAALESRIVIEQAKGVLAQHDQIGVDDAFARIRAFARTNHLLLSDTARRIVSGSLSLHDLADASQRPAGKPRSSDRG
jgi:GAF domain-containing protein